MCPHTAHRSCSPFLSPFPSISLSSSFISFPSHCRCERKRGDCFFCGDPPRGGACTSCHLSVRLSVCQMGIIKFLRWDFSDGLQFQAKRKKEPTWPQTIGGNTRKSVPSNFDKLSAARYIRVYHEILGLTWSSFGQQQADFGKRGVGGFAFFWVLDKPRTCFCLVTTIPRRNRRSV